MNHYLGTLASVAGTAAFLLLASEGAKASEAPATAEHQTHATSLKGQERPWDRGSRLIGQEVRNPQGEYFGRISEVALDIDRSAPPYAVILSAMPGLSGERWHMVPLDALHPSPDGNSQILDATPKQFSRSLALRYDDRQIREELQRQAALQERLRRVMDNPSTHTAATSLIR